MRDKELGLDKWGQVGYNTCGMTRSHVCQLVADAPWVLQGTVVERHLRCRREGCRVCREQGGHGPVYYLSVRGEDGKTRMVYVPKARLGEVGAGVAAFRRLKEGLGELAAGDLRRWCGEARRRRR